MKGKSQSEKFADWIYSNPNFQEDVKKIRVVFRIPKEGFKKKTDGDKFLKKIVSEAFKITEDPKFIEKRKHLYKKMLLDEITRNKWIEEVRELEKKVPYFALGQEIEKLQLKHKISNHWRFALHQHIIAGGKEWVIGCVPGIFSLPQGGSEIRISVDENATLDDLKKVWPSVKEFQKQLKNYRNKKLRKPKRFSRDVKIVELHHQGLTHSGIMKKINDSTPSGDIIGYEYVSKILKRYKARGR